MVQIANLRRNAVKRIALSLVAFAAMVCMVSCDSKPNDKLKIDGRKYAISLGSVTYDADAGLVTIEVLADGKPLQNTKTHTNSGITIDGQQISSGASVSQPVNMSLLNDYRMIPMSDAVSSSEDGVFIFAVDKAPEKITVFTSATTGGSVYFDGKTKAVLTEEEFYPPIQEKD